MLVLSVLMNFSVVTKKQKPTLKFLQARHGGSTSEYTDVLIFLLSHGKELSNCFIKKWKSWKSRNVQLFDVVDNIVKKLKRETLWLS